MDPHFSEEESKSRRGSSATPSTEHSDNPSAMKSSSQAERVDRQLSFLKEAALQGCYKAKGRQHRSAAPWHL